jgi:hypothetical protein
VAGLGSHSDFISTKDNFIPGCEKSKDNQRIPPLRGYRKGAATLIVKEEVAPVEIVIPI